MFVVRERSGLRVVAREATDESTTRSPIALVTLDAPAAAPTRVSVEATFTAAGMALGITRSGRHHELGREEIARHPALSAVLRLIADEVDLGRSESRELLGFLLQSVLVYTRRMLRDNPLPKWGRPVRDRRIERALELLDTDLSERWTVERLARAVGLSRAVFARQFLRVLGESPMRYLTQRRLELAASLLSSSDASLAEIAARVGYDSEFSFNRAFKRHHGVPPGIYRRRTTTTLQTRAQTSLRLAA